MSLRTKIVWTYIGLTAVGVALASLISSWQINNYLERRLTLSLHEEVEMLATLFGKGSLSAGGGARDAELRQVAQNLNVRITVLRKDGIVLYDSEVPRDSLWRLENHGSRPEVLRARGWGVGTDRRRSASLNQEFLYASKRISGADLGQVDSGYVRLALRVDDIASLDAQVQAIVWSVGLLTILVILLVSLQVSRRITRPILEIAATAQAIKQGDLQQRIRVSSADEMGRLATAINDMAEKLSTDIAQLRKLERVRSEFLGNVSHELRTPIFSLQGFLETLLDGAVDDPAVNREFLAKAHAHAARLNALLNDLIEISRIESGEMKMSFRYFDVMDFLHRVTEEMRPQAEKKGLTLTFLPRVGDDERVFGDRDRLKQVMVNLIDNALKYTDRGGSVTCSVWHENSGSVIAVEDTGCGIAPEHLPRIFERFYRVDRDRSREVGGTGLGLAIVKHIVEAHGGKITVTSVVGKGSTFSFTLKGG